MKATPVSVVIVSRGRPDLLQRCLTGLGQLYHPNFEIIVVADPEGLDSLGQRSRLVKAVGFDRPNISAARNLGIAEAAGRIVAFIDDDAVPEPTWLDHLCQPFENPEVVAAGGYVRGRNGISFQWKGRTADAFGGHRDLAQDDRPRVYRGQRGCAIKTEGTNCAFRADTLRAMGGFDPVFAFFNDETDLNLRLAETGAACAIVPLAQVHHGYAASERRAANRMPRSLFDIGASTVLLLRKHAPDTDPTPVLRDLRDEQLLRLERHRAAGNCDADSISCLMASLDDGIREGQERALRDLPPIPAASAPFRPYPAATGPMHVLAGPTSQARSLKARAASIARDGGRASLFLFKASPRYHRVAFDPDGFWLQTGGIWGRADRDGPLISMHGFASRLRAEKKRLQPVRRFTD